MEQSGPTPAAAAAQRLRVDFATAEVLRAFEAAGVSTILLKGASIVRWLYRDGPPRGYVDCDLLVRPKDAKAAGEILTRLGFVPELEEEQMPEWWREHGLAWTRRRDGANIDLHRTLPGVEVSAERLWAALSAQTEVVEVAGFPAPALSIPGRAFHVALHAAQHHGWPEQTAELQRALEHADEAIWRDAAELADAVQANGAFATGLRLVPAGAALADRLGLASAASLEVALRAGDAPAEALTIERLTRARGVRARLGIMRHKLAPPPTYMRKWWPGARRGRLALAAAYLRRPFWILRRAPAAIHAWREARRSSSS